MKRRDRTAQSLATQLSRLGRISQADDRSAELACASATVENLHSPSQSTKGAESLGPLDRKSTRLNSSHVRISYAVFCLKKKKTLHFCAFDRKSKSLNSRHF